MSYTASIAHHIDVDIQNTSGIRILVSTDGADWCDEYSISVDSNLGDSDLILATQKAVKAYVDTHQKWSENEYGIYHIENVVIGGEPNHSTSISDACLHVLGPIKANELSLSNNILFNEDHGLDWGGGDSSFYMGSDGIVHILGMDGIYLKHSNGIIATINSHGLGIGTAAYADGELAVAGTIVSDNAIRVLSASSDLSISTNTTSSLHVISSTDFPIAILEEGEAGGGVVISKGALYPYTSEVINLGQSTKRFREAYINSILLKGDITSSKDGDTEIKNTVADKHILLKTATGNGKVKMNKAMSFQLTLMDGGELNVGTTYEKLGRQTIPPEMDRLKLVGVRISCNPQVGDTDFYVHVHRSPGNATNVTYNNLILEDSAKFRLDGVTYSHVTNTGTMVANPTVYDYDSITVSARYASTPGTKAQDVCVTLLFDF